MTSVKIEVQNFIASLFTVLEQQTNEASDIRIQIDRKREEHCCTLENPRNILLPKIHLKNFLKGFLSF